MSSIESGTGYAFLFSEDVAAQLNRRVTFSVTTATAAQLFDRLFSGSNVTYRIVDRQVLLSLRPAAQQQTSPTTGRVTDENGNPLAGAAVIVTGTYVGTSTDPDGRFSFVVPAGSASLDVSYIGMNPQTVALRAGVTNYNITMASSSTEIEQVVAIGYFNRSKDNFTGSAVVVSGEDLRRMNPNNLLQSIESFDPSFKVAPNNLMGSDPNSLPNINIRGAASVPTGASSDVLRRDNIANSVNMPTFILDGYEVGVEKIYDLDINRIESISILKDAAATAVYGSRAANGVLVITTIAPKEGKMSLSVNYELNASFPDLSSYDVLNAKEKLRYEELAGLYDHEIAGNLPQQALTELYYKKLYNVVSGMDTDWIAQPARNAFGNKVSLFLEGGSETVRYGITGQYQDMPGVMKGSGRERLGFGVDLSYNANSNLIFKNVLSVANVGGKDSPYGSFADYVKMNPYYRKTDELGNIIQRIDTWEEKKDTGEDNNHIVLNPLYNATLSSFSRDKYWEINDAFTIEWFIAEGLKFRGLVSYLHKDATSDIFVSPLANEFQYVAGSSLDEKYKDRTKRGSYEFASSEQNFFDASATLTYGRGFGGHFINAALGTNMRTGNTKIKTFKAIGFTNDRFSDIGFAKGYEENASPSSIKDIERLFGAFMSINYSYDNRFLIDVSGRLDGSSKFGGNNNIAPFWAVGIGWNLHNEEFMRSLGTVSQLRLKANTGLTGSVSFSPYMANTLYKYDKDNWYSTGVGAYVTQYGNENLKWQKTQNYDVGLDVGLLQDRFFITGHYYYKLTKDMLADITLPTSTGFSYYRENLGDIKNTGYEIGLKLNVFKNEDWNITITGNFVHNQNKLVKISDALKKMNDKADENQTDPDKDLLGVPLLRYNEGQSLNTIYAVRSLGIDPESGREIYVDRDGNLTYFWDVKDIAPICDPTSKLDGFFGGSVYYKGFMLTLSFFTRFGGYEYNQTLIDKVENADPRYNVDRRALESRWTTPGQKTLYKNIQEHGETRVTERFIQRDNALELRSVYFSYDFKPELYKKLGMNSLRVALSANDVWRTATIDLERGINYPFARSITLSLQTSF